MATDHTRAGSRLAPVTPDEAVSGIRSGDRVYIGSGAAEPDSLVEALTARAPALRDVRLLHALTFGPARYAAPEHAASFRVTTFFISPNVREAVAAGRADFVPVFLHETGRLCQDLDWALVQLSPPDRHGFCSTGVSADVTVAALRTARHVAAEINPRMPRTLGDTLVHIDRLARITEVDRPLPELAPPSVSPPMRRISEQIAEMIGDGDCLQIGIGGIPNTVLAMIGDRRHLGVHTEMLTDGIVALHRAGAIDGSRKTVMPGHIVCTFAAGTRPLYDFVHDNPLVSFRACDFTNDPHVIGQNDNVVAVNSALQIDLTGQVDADSIGPHIFSGIGGQVDFIRGASRSNGGKAVIALLSTAKDDEVTRVCTYLDEGAGVVTSRADVHYVVTEFGIADLHGKSLRERARALIGIAHPKFRDELERGARARRLL